MLWFKPDLEKIKPIYKKKREIKNFWDFKHVLPKIGREFMISLGEGATPCRVSKRLGKILGINHLFLKDEIQNPTNSFKDRTAALLISHARSWNYHKVICASNGNQGASIAAYTSLEGMDCLNIIPMEVDVGKKAQMIAYNSRIIEKGNTVDDALKEALKENYKKKYYQCTPEFNPLTLEGEKTIAHEIFLQIGMPNWVIIPMGSGGLLISIWKGFKELIELDLIHEMPKLVGVQSQACAPIVNSFHENDLSYKKNPLTLKSHALGIMVKKPIYQSLVIKALKENNGMALAIPENLILTSEAELARNEGIFAEPASVLTIAALKILIKEGIIQKDDAVVCLITGSGLKTPHVLEALSSRTKTAGLGGILSTKLKILSQISLSNQTGIYGTKIKETMSTISLPAIYQHLKELESKNLIYRKKKGKYVYYFISEKGQKVLEALEILINLL
ncbi:MAG: pyridoxal-phosphate dependent enzyme [Promethearchaeota archaeon]